MRAFLSGGIDSSLVVALMQAQSTKPVRTFSVGNEQAEYDEGVAAAGVARHLGTHHTAFAVTARDALEVIPTLGSVCDEPFADSSLVPTLLVSRLARQQVTVAMSGDGGDEIFGGYNRHLSGPRLWTWLARVPSQLRSSGSGALRRVPPGFYDELARWTLPSAVRPA